MALHSLAKFHRLRAQSSLRLHSFMLFFISILVGATLIVFRVYLLLTLLCTQQSFLVVFKKPYRDWTQVGYGARQKPYLRVIPAFYIYFWFPAFWEIPELSLPLINWIWIWQVSLTPFGGGCYSLKQLNITWENFS